MNSIRKGGSHGYRRRILLCRKACYSSSIYSDFPVKVPLLIPLKGLSFLSPNDDCEIKGEIELKARERFVMFSRASILHRTGL
jgi:hypothetical protein